MKTGDQCKINHRLKNKPNGFISEVLLRLFFMVLLLPFFLWGFFSFWWGSWPHWACVTLAVLYSFLSALFSGVSDSAGVVFPHATIQ